MRISFAAAEVAPYAKVGGLADVAGSLPQALAALGHDVSVYIPYHRSIDAEKFGIPTSGARTNSIPYGAAHARIEYPEISRDGVRTVFVRNVRIGRDKVYGYPDDAKRYALFCRAVLADLIDSLPEVVHAHDWHAALLVPLAARARQLRGAATVFTIHNLAYQGRTSADVLKLVGLPRSRLAIEDRGEANPMARAIATADIVSTVSERYAEEILTKEFGERLDGLLRERRADLWGITNGIDTAFFDPMRDPHIAAHYSADDQAGKAINKAALQRETGLTADPAAPLFGVVGRLVEQKGVDLLTAVGPWLLEKKAAQLVVLGSGDPAYEQKWRDLAARAKGRLALTLGFDAALAQRIYAGADLFLMPSRFEPCGLGQLISLRYGTIPVVRAVGGLATTVRDVDADPRGNGFSFAKYEAAAFADAIERALHRYRAGRQPWLVLRTRAMREDHSWTASAKRYVEMYTAAAKARRAA
ncbi:MAG TPA: glycogen/starch synthase [Candidatus Limnocylindria bacterium]|nr:glycogen/starch synthase [Candidatus Limnocylindria bacterium]